MSPIEISTGRRALGVALLMCAVAVAAVGCSDDNPTVIDETTTSTVEPPPAPVPTLDHAAYLQRLNDVCTSPELGGAVGALVDDSASVEEIDAQVSALTDRLDLMREPDVPAEDQDAFDAVELAYDRAIATMADLSSAVEAGDTATASELASELEDLRVEVNVAVATAGVDACSL